MSAAGGMGDLISVFLMAPGLRAMAGAAFDKEGERVIEDVACGVLLSAALGEGELF